MVFFMLATILVIVVIAAATVAAERFSVLGIAALFLINMALIAIVGERIAGTIGIHPFMIQMLLSLIYFLVYTLVLEAAIKEKEKIERTKRK